MNKQQIESIIANAPEGASHFDGVNYFRECELPQPCMRWDEYDAQDEDWFETSASPEQSLADLRQILSLMERVAELEKERDEWKAKYIFAERVTDCAERHLHDEHFDYYCEEVDELKQAEQMK